MHVCGRSVLVSLPLVRQRVHTTICRRRGAPIAGGPHTPPLTLIPHPPPKPAPAARASGPTQRFLAEVKQQAMTAVVIPVLALSLPSLAVRVRLWPCVCLWPPSQRPHDPGRLLLLLTSVLGVALGRTTPMIGLRCSDVCKHKQRWQSLVACIFRRWLACLLLLGGMPCSPANASLTPLTPRCVPDHLM